MERVSDYYGVVRMSNKVVEGYGCACYCTCRSGNSSPQKTTLTNYLSSGSYR